MPNFMAEAPVRKPGKAASSAKDTSPRAVVTAVTVGDAAPLFKLNASYVIAPNQATEDLVEDLDMLLSNAQACFDADHEDLSGVAWSGAHYLRMAANIWGEIRNRVNFETAGSPA